MTNDHSGPRILAPLENRIPGDEALLQLARLRYQEAGLGIEIYPDTPQALDYFLGFRPAANAPVVAHIPRELDPLNRESRKTITAFARSSAARVYGIVLHDQEETTTRRHEYLAALTELNQQLKDVPDGPYLFIEYAVGLEFQHFVSLFESIQELDRVSACIDIGHLGLKQTRYAYSQKHPRQEVCSLAPDDPLLGDLIEDVHNAVRSALPLVLEILETLAAINKPLHIHLHDGHPLSTDSPYGVSDHLSFLGEITIPFEFKGGRSLPLMFGPSGLSQIVARAGQILAPHLLSFTLEIHPDQGSRLALGDFSYLFRHWEDKTNAERVNHWLSVLGNNHRLLLEALGVTDINDIA